MKSTIATLLILLLSTQPALASPELSRRAYNLRPYDTLKISVVNQPQLATEQSITPDGQLSLPFLGLFRVQGLTLNQLEGKYKIALTPFIQKPQIVIQLKPAPIYVIQHNLKDSTYDVKIAQSTTEALALAGGPSSKLRITSDELRSPLSQVTNDQLRVTIDHGSVLSVSQGEHPDWWEKNWYRVISAVAVVTGVYLSVRR